MRSLILIAATVSLISACERVAQPEITETFTSPGIVGEYEIPEEKSTISYSTSTSAPGSMISYNSNTSVNPYSYGPGVAISNQHTDAPVTFPEAVLVNYNRTFVLEVEPRTSTIRERQKMQELTDSCMKRYAAEWPNRVWNQEVTNSLRPADCIKEGLIGPLSGFQVRYAHIH